MDIFREIELVLWTTVLTICFYPAVKYMRKVGDYGRDEKMIRKSLLSWGLFFIFTALGNIFGVIHRLYMWELFGRFSFPSEFIDKISITLVILGIAFKVYYLEKFLNLTRIPLATVIICASIILHWCWWRPLGDTGLVILASAFILEIAGFIIFPLLYLYIAIKSEGILRQSAVKILIGVIILEIALTIQAHNIEVIYPNFTENFSVLYGFPYQLTTPPEVLIGIIMIDRGVSKVA